MAWSSVRSFLIVFALILVAASIWRRDSSEDGDDNLANVPLLNLTLAAQCVAKIITIDTTTRKYLGELEVRNPMDIPERVSNLTDTLKALAKQFKDVRPLLAKSFTRSKGAQLFRSLHNHAAQIQKEYDNWTTQINGVTNPGLFADMGQRVLNQHNPNVKTDLEDIAQTGKKLLRDCVGFLEGQYLFPKRAKSVGLGVGAGKNGKGWPTLDRQTLLDYVELLHQASEVNVQHQDALRKANNREFRAVKVADAKLYNLIVKKIPAFLKKHGRTLSSVLPVLTLRLDNMKPPNPTYDLAVEFEDELRKHVEMLRILEADGKSEALEVAYEELQEAEMLAVVEYTKYFKLPDGRGVQKLQERQRHEL